MVRAAFRLCLFTLLGACGSDATTTTLDGVGTGFRVGDLLDIDGDGRPDGRAVSSNGGGVDGIDTDGDGIADQPLGSARAVNRWPNVGDDVDTNADQIPDGKAIDTDGNGIADAIDSNGDGAPDGYLIPPRGQSGADGDPGFEPGDGASADGSAADGESGDGDEGCGAIEKEAEFSRGPVDIILAIDTSGSMSQEVCNVSDNLTDFANGIGDTAHVVAVYEMGWELGFQAALFCDAEDPLAGTALARDASRYRQVKSAVGSNDALEVLLAEYDRYKDFLRPGAPTHFLVVSDDESDLAADAFRTLMRDKLGHDFYFHAIVADGSTDCGAADVGAQHLMLADLTGGEKLNICESDWSLLFTQLEAAVVQSAPLPCDFEIPPPPDGEKLDPAAVQVVFTPVGGSEGEFPRANAAEQCGEATGWYYDDAAKPTRIQFCPQACEAIKAGGAVGIAFGCAPEVVPF